jgi:undecaprenyl diphosphate synthase
MKQDPQHVAIIMDGNGRWAMSRGLPRMEGHRQGVQALKRLLEALPETGVRYLTVYAFSSENWARPMEERSFLMGLLRHYALEHADELFEKGIRLHVIGAIEAFPTDLQGVLKQAMEKTASCDQYHLILALNYGSRMEILRAARLYAENGSMEEGLDWATFKQYLYTAPFPDPDLLIRTSGEERLSNFLLLQCAYAEFFTTEVFWPDFRPEHFHEALEVYRQRERRYGRSLALAENPLDY